jgi:hypothetical protein
MLALSVSVLAAPLSRTFVGVVTDTMCGASHAAMKITPDEKCVRDCVKGGDKFALSDGKTTYTLNDRQSAEKFVGKKVKVTGVLYEKTNTIAVEKIEPAK